ncbi:MAG TPA: hypothetical protein VGC77_11865 [Rhodopseudomonas sp.]|uniref:hypothetical protein n=1 Tax=Rhodopseudomonas sp. TaxID=1078 RepID=UPI002ED964A6
MLKVSAIGDILTLRFTLKGGDGSIMCGERSFTADTQFATVSDLVDVLWEGELFDVKDGHEAHKVSLLWSVPIIVAALGISFDMQQEFNAVMRTAILPLTFAVCIASVLLGTLHGVLVTLGVGAGFHFWLAPGQSIPDEYPRMLFWVALAFLLPFLASRATGIIGWVSRWEAQLKQKMIH